MKKVDVVVIGGGPGGYVCAIRLAQFGKKVILIEKHKLGGECLNYGCIPSKSLIFASTLYDKIKKASQFGIEVGNVTFNSDKLQTWRKNLISKLNQGIAYLLKQNQVEVVSGEAQFISPHTISVNTDQIEADDFVIATGSESIQIPGFEFDGNLVIGSKEALELSPLPQKILVLGGGVIGLELGMYFSKLGVQVSVVEMMPQILPGVDKDLVSVIERAFKKNNIEVFTNSKATQCEKSEKVTITLEQNGETKELTGDKLLVTIGRKACTKNLDLDKAGIECDGKGFIKVNEELKSSTPHIYAIGDVNGPPLLAHKASAQGIQVAKAISKGKKATKKPVSWAIFTDPEIAGVGLTEAEAQKKGHTVQVGKFPFLALGRALAIGEVEGFVKIIADKNTEEVLGVFIVGSHASDLISEGALAVTHKLKLSDIANTIHPHPTLPEALMEGAEAALGHAIHIPNR